MLPVVGLRLMEGRVGSTLLMQLLASAPEVALDRRYPFGEYRYLSYCVRAAAHITSSFESGGHPGVNEMFFGSGDPFGPLPFVPDLITPDSATDPLLAHIWEVFSAGMLEGHPEFRCYAEKLVAPIEPLMAAEIPLRVVDCIRDPRDVLVSIRAFTLAGGSVGLGRQAGEAEASYVGGFVDRVARRLDEMAKTSPSIDRITLRYEDFGPNLSACSAQLSAWLGVDLDINGAASARLAQHCTTASVSESIGRWKRELHPDEAGLIWERLGSRLQRHGYEP